MAASAGSSRACPPPQHRYGSNKKTATSSPTVSSSSLCEQSDLDLLMMHNRRYCAEIGHDVSTQNRKAIVERAMQLNVNVINKDARLSSQEAE